MVARTYHVFPLDGHWAVKKEGITAVSYRTRREAIEAARTVAKKANGAQLVVHGKDGGIREHESYGLTPVQDPPKKSRLAKRISRAVGRVALERVQSNPHISGVTSPEK